MLHRGVFSERGNAINAYHALAVSYDRLTADVDYEAIVAFYEQILLKEGVRPRSAIDLACGTGSVALLLAKKYERVIGVDLSEEMLTVAFQRAVEQALDSGTPVYGILQMADSEFLDRIAAREDVCVITVTEENRNDLPRQLLEQGW